MAALNSHRVAVRWAVGAMAAYAVLVGVFLLSQDGDPRWFLHAGRDQAVVELGRTVLGRDLPVPHHDGHDGMQFWLLARDPLLLEEDQALRYLDRPAYRAQRIGYPLVAAPWRLAGEDALVWGMLLTNLAAVGLGAYAATRLAMELGAPPRAGLGFALNPAVFAAVIIDAADVLVIATLLFVLLLVLRRHVLGAVAVATACVLIKEPVLLAMAAIAWSSPQLPRRARLALVAVPATAAAAWALYARWRLGWPPSEIEEFTGPFAGFLDAYRRGWKPLGDWANATFAVAAVAFAALVAVQWYRRRDALLWAALPFVVLVPFFTAQVVNLPGNIWRAVGPAVTLAWISAYLPRDERGPSPLTPSPRLSPR